MKRIISAIAHRANSTYDGGLKRRAAARTAFDNYIAAKHAADADDLLESRVRNARIAQARQKAVVAFNEKHVDLDLVKVETAHLRKMMEPGELMRAARFTPWREDPNRPGEPLAIQEVLERMERAEARERVREASVEELIVDLERFAATPDDPDEKDVAMVDRIAARVRRPDFGSSPAHSKAREKLISAEQRLASMPKLDEIERKLKAAEGLHRTADQYAYAIDRPNDLPTSVAMDRSFLRGDVEEDVYTIKAEKAAA